jgi:V/A-type H+/Na+-transporting ATPase subunit I
MSVSSMSKVNILFKSDDKEQVVSRLQDLAFVQLIDHTADTSLKSIDLEETKSQVDYLRAGISFAIEYLSPFEEKKGSFLDRLVAGKPIFSKKQLSKEINSTDYSGIVEAVQQLESSINEVKNELEALKAEHKQITPWQKVPFVLNHKTTAQNFDYILAVNQIDGFRKIFDKLDEEKIIFEGNKVNDDPKNQYFYLVMSRKDQKKTEQILLELGSELIEIDKMEVTVKSQLEAITTETAGLEKELETLQNQASHLSTHLPQLRVGYDYYSWEKSKTDALTQAAQTKSIAVLAAWVENNNKAKLEKELSQVAQTTAVVEIPLAADEEPPVMMRNKKWAEPFEAITGIYGAPQYGEPDPTAWLTPFFVVFFGLALTDTGYGILLAVLSLLGLKFLASTEEAKKLMKVLLVGGVATAVLGILFGGWMGIQLDSLPSSGIKNALIGVRLVDPIANPIAVLLLSFALGIIQVMVGLFVSLKWQLKHGARQEAILGPGVWLVFLGVLILWTLAKASVLPVGSLSVITPVLLGATALVVLAGTRKTKNWLLKLPVGLVGLYDLVGYFSDVLSYSRLLALGLGTGIIAMVVNLIAGIAFDMVPFVGWVFAILILIGGHAFNIAINVLGAYIHSSRLQFVEFFPKFMEGGGKTFQPFRKENQYIRLSE